MKALSWIPVFWPLFFAIFIIVASESAHVEEGSVSHIQDTGSTQIQVSDFVPDTTAQTRDHIAVTSYKSEE